MNHPSIPLAPKGWLFWQAARIVSDVTLVTCCGEEAMVERGLMNGVRLASIPVGGVRGIEHDAWESPSHVH